jgi:CubicO group peptidase (beta-lactamase class C family)
MPGFGHAGVNGSLGWADPATGMAFAFVHNRLLTPMVWDQTTFIGLALLLRRAAAAARAHGPQVVADLGAPYPQPGPGAVAG